MQPQRWGTGNVAVQLGICFRIKPNGRWGCDRSDSLHLLTRILAGFVQCMWENNGLLKNRKLMLMV